MDSPHAAGSTLVQVKCPACGADLAADGCPHCDASGPSAPKTAQAVGEVDLETLLSSEAQAPLPEPGALQGLSCRSCGAQTSHPPEARVLHCPFCASPSIGEESLGCWFRPTGLLPFAVPPEEAARSIRTWASKLRLRPSRLSKLATPQILDRVYIPFWTVDCRAETSWKGSLTTNEGSEDKPKIAVLPVDGRRRAQYADLLVCASRGLPRRLVQGIEPFSTLTGLVAYEPRMLSGFLAERSAIGVQEAWERVEEHLRIAEYDKSVDNAKIRPGDRADLKLEYRFLERRGKPVLLPVYVAAYRYGRKSYRVLVNGETGAVAGEAPYSWGKLALLALLLVALTVLTAGSDLAVVAVLMGIWWLYDWLCKWTGRRRALKKAPSRYR